MPLRTGFRTPLALAILDLLYEEPLHPYEMQRRMKERGHDQVIKLKGGSLYNVIARLETAGLIEPQETSREGRRPERTVYAVTDKGRHELRLWLQELIAEPIKEYPWFGAALAFLGALPPDEAQMLLERRAMRLEADVAAMETIERRVEEIGLARLFAVEGEYSLAMCRAELAWVRQLIDDMRAGRLTWPPEVVEFHQRNPLV